MTSSTLSRVVSLSTLCILIFVPSGYLAAQLPAPAASLPLAPLDADPGIPTLQTITGHDWAAHVTDQAELERYLDALVKAAPDRTRLEKYGESYEGRGLHYLILSSAANMQRLEEIRTANLQLADPQQTTAAQALPLIAGMPAVVWLAASVHGNELSGTDAALLTAYHLLADQRAPTRQLLDHLVIIIDPLQNPDGRARFVNVYRESRGVFDSAHPLSTEHAERWPGGRFNHYLFDLNRDWFLQSQQETQYKVQAYRQWQPQIYVDAHEMGHNSSYFFVPPSDPINPFLLAKQKDLAWQLGRRQADWFDRYGFAYTTREMFDAFYPGYGSEWPSLQGGLGVLWEQAGTRGLLVDRDDETTLPYREAVLHHYVSSLATLEIAAEHREELRANFYDACQRSVELGDEGPVRNFVLPAGPRADRTAKLVQLLERNGVRVQRVTKTFRVSGTEVRSGKPVKRRVPRGSYVIPVAQPTGRLIRTLLDRQVDMDAEYVQRQLDRKEDHLPDEIYDVTAWSLPLAFDVPCLATPRSIPADVVADNASSPPASDAQLAPAQVAYLVAPTDGALLALSDWLQQGVRVHVTDESFTLDDREFPRGTLIVKTHENPDRLTEIVQQTSQRLGIQAIPANTGFVAEGAHFGGPHVKWVRPPKIALAVDRPTGYAVGHTWYVFDQVLRYPTTRVSCQHLGGLELHKFNVLILPSGNYTEDPGFTKEFADRLGQWVREGGTLVLVADAALWAAQEKIGLLKLERVAKPDAAGVAKKSPETPKPEGNADAESAQRWPDSVPGAFLRADVFQKHWLTFGCSASLSVFFHGNIFFQPVPIEEGRSLVTFAPHDPLVSGGFCWPATKELIAGKTFLAYKPLGEGHLVTFAADPNYRAMYPNLQRLFLNACLFGPGQ